MSFLCNRFLLVQNEFSLDFRVTSQPFHFSTAVFFILFYLLKVYFGIISSLSFLYSFVLFKNSFIIKHVFSRYLCKLFYLIVACKMDQCINSIQLDVIIVLI